jgi:hypothetical protein
MIERAIREGWISPANTPPGFFDMLAKKTVGHIEISEANGDMRSMAAGLRVGVALAQYNLDLAQALDKAARLDAEKPTEVVKQVEFKVEFDSGG